MSARYSILVADGIDLSVLPDGFRLVEQWEQGPASGEHWWLVEDEGAPEELAGKKIRLVLSIIHNSGGKTVVIHSREVIQDAESEPESSGDAT